MTNVFSRRALAGFLAALFGSFKTNGAIRKESAVGMRIACSFTFEGNKYGLCVPVVQNRHSVPEKDMKALPEITLTPEDLRMYARMLNDLAWSHDESLRMLKAGTYNSFTGIAPENRRAA